MGARPPSHGNHLRAGGQEVTCRKAWASKDLRGNQMVHSRATPTSQTASLPPALGSVLGATSMPTAEIQDRFAWGEPACGQHCLWGPLGEGKFGAYRTGI